MNVLGVILARGGSKRVPGKNWRRLGGKPLLAWTIEAAVQARSLTEVAVSTENYKILEIAKRHRVNLVMRPTELASDQASSYSALRHTLNQRERYGGRTFDYVCLLQPTSPFRVTADIDACVWLAAGNGFDYVCSAEQGKKVPNGAVYVGRSDWLRSGGDFDHDPILYFMPPERSLDIDTEEDFGRAMAMAEGLAA